MKRKVEEEIEKLVKDGILKPVEFSEWVVPVIPVLKPDNTMRLYGNYKVTVNQVSTLGPYLLPTSENISAKFLSGRKTLDLSHRPLS